MTSALWLGALFTALLVIGLAGLMWNQANGQSKNRVDENAAELLAAGWLPLVDCPRDRNACLRCLQVDSCVIHRLSEMGFTPGTQVRVVQDAGGPMLLSVRGSRVALGRDLAGRMWVELPLVEPVCSPHRS